MVISTTITNQDKINSNCNFDDFIFSPLDSDSDSFEIFDQRVNNVNYIYRSSYLERPQQLDELDELLSLYEPCNPNCVPFNVNVPFKAKNSRWKRFLFLFRKSKKN